MAVSGAMLGLILTEALSPGIANVPWGGTVGLRASTTFPGLAAPGVALTVNLAGTALFVLSSAMAAWGAAAHVAWALRVSVGVNAAYGVFLLGISAAGIVVAIMGDNDTAALPQVHVPPRARPPPCFPSTILRRLSEFLVECACWSTVGKKTVTAPHSPVCIRGLV